MSGGKFYYHNDSLQSDIFGWVNEGEKIPNVFEDREISELIYDVFELIHDYDWYACGDTSEETYLKEKNKFKKKWFDTPRKDRVKKIVDSTLEDAKEELYKTYGIKEKKTTNGEEVKKMFPNGEVFTQHESFNAVVVKFSKDWWESEVE